MPGGRGERAPINISFAERVKLKPRALLSQHPPTPSAGNSGPRQATGEDFPPSLFPETRLKLASISYAPPSWGRMSTRGGSGARTA